MGKPASITSTFMRTSWRADEELFLGIHAGARRLLTVAQGGVKDCDFAAYMFLLIDRFMTDGFQEREKA